MIQAATYSRWSCGSGTRDRIGHSRARSASGRLSARLVLAGLLAGIVCALASSSAAADGCPSLDDSYTGNCGPMFAVPTWTDAGGWSDPSQYSTIRLADFDGDGVDELIGRSDAGVQIYRFDTAWGQWRPQVDADGVPQLLNDFASFLPFDAWDPRDPNQPDFYSTIQAADIDGQPGAEILGRFWDGMRVYKYTPPAGGGIDGGSWSRIGMRGPFSGYYDASLYSTIGVGQFKNGQLPYLFARKHSSSFTDAPVVFYRWSGGAWSKVAMPYDNEGYYFDFIDSNCSEPSCYLTLQVSNLAPGGRGADNNPGSAPDDTAELTGRTSLGAEMWDIDARGRWSFLNLDFDFTPDGLPPFGDASEPGTDWVPDCPFSVGGATGAGSADCLGSSPSYYETFQAADIDGVAGDELLARASDGLRVKKWVPGTSGGSWDVLATLTALAGAATSVADGTWGSIRTADIDGDGKQEVLFLDGKGLQAWSYNPGQKAWKQLPASPALALASDPWLSHPEYYSTIQTGDVDGDKREDVIARGPYGIRTWFYNRRGTGGWERYLADGYPAFPTRPCSAGVTGLCGRQAAYDALNSAYRTALTRTGAIRDVWTQENAPNPGFSTDLLTDLESPGIGNCSSAGGNQTSLAPPQYTSCTPPPGSTGFTQDEWTPVVNEILAEAFAADQVVGFFSDLKGMRDDLFLQESAELPAIGGDLGLQAAAGNTAQFNPLTLMSGSLGIAASIAGLIPEGGPELSAALWVAAEATSMIPQTSSTATSSAFPSTYAGLQAKFATMVSETEKGIAVMSQQVRQDASLLGLVGQLRASGPWAPNNLDTIGIKSAANQGFASWAYQTLMPTVYERYDITQCAEYGNATCYGPSAGRYVINGATSTNNEVPFKFIALGPPRDLDGGVPCENYEDPDCTFTTPPVDLMSSVWGTPSETCTYVPGKSGTAWTFGCNAGVDILTTVAKNTWNFTTHSGSFDVSTSHCYHQFGGCWHATQARSAARVRSRARPAQALAGRRPIRLGRPRSGRRRAVRGRAQIRARIGLPRGMRLAGATVRLNRLLFEPGYRELTAPRARRGPQRLKLRLSRIGAGRFAAATSGRRPVRITVRRNRRGGASLTLTSARIHHTPRACHALPAAVARKTQPLWLHTRLVIGDGRHHRPIDLRHHMRCRRDARGNVDRLKYVRYRHHTLRAGLALTLRGPRSVRPGATATYVARMHNRRHGRNRIVSSLWDITLIRGAHTQRIHELRRGRTRSFSFTVRVPQSTGTARVPRGAGAVRVPGTPRGRFCVGVRASAPGARADSAHVCSRLRATLPPKLTG